MRQKIRILRSTDGVNLAWATAGSGPALIRASTWLTHLEFDWDSPVWRHWLDFLAGHFTLIRYDEPGSGLSDWDVEDLGWRRWAGDFEAVVAAADPPKPFIVLGISQGGVAALSYAVRFPENVSHLILCGAYARGWNERDLSDGAQQYRAIVELTRLGWGQENPVYRQLFSARFVPEGSREQFDWFNELCRKTTRPEIATRMLEERGRVNALDLASQVRVPTLVMHATHDEVVPLTEGRLLAARIPDARFVQLDSRNHVLLEHEPAWQRFREEVLAFTGLAAGYGEEDPVFRKLSPREREILLLMSRGLSNVRIGESLFISEKTVRNHVTHVFEKLGVRSRAEAIVRARDGGLQSTETAD